METREFWRQSSLVCPERSSGHVVGPVHSGPHYRVRVDSWVDDMVEEW